MSDVEISQKQQIDSNDQKPDGKSVTESLTGILKEDDLDTRMKFRESRTRTSTSAGTRSFMCRGLALMV